MASLAIPPPAPRWPPNREALLAKLLPIPHSPESMDGISYYDEEFAMAQSDAHRKNVYYLGGWLDRVAAVAGLRGVGDYPIWYWIPEQGAQSALYPDYARSLPPPLQYRFHTRVPSLFRLRRDERIGRTKRHPPIPGDSLAVRAEALRNANDRSGFPGQRGARGGGDLYFFLYAYNQ